jgi:hypothetical protein
MSRALNENKGKKMMFISCICILTGIIACANFQTLKHSHIPPIRYCANEFGRVACTVFMIVTGLVVGLLGYRKYRQAENR